ncbi:TetR/AcrR family transcriptional regulator [Amycolatopsis jiangsuensis]|uniref:AcrR family transcriptional regulator n=1 Tax=Amycolatopsis jiangsuensis TaxID=1181879 RepID=A0A840IUC8_9PSEU|nr:TetR family transcriptional regulator [Amycolatopsis jiangsuensis]MBB4686281.1 AcrR family transcriptional regulator [Amycolatopsis jiangsuensis]
MAAGSKPLRADAARNRTKLLSAATRAFAERGLDTPLEQIARDAGVSIGTLYAHFATRDALFDAVLPAQIAVLDDLIGQALAEPDPWQGFTAFVESLFTLQANDSGLNDALAGRFPLSPVVLEACHAGLERATRVLDRAKAAGRLRPDFEVGDLTPLMVSMSQLFRSGAAPEAWRRHLGFFLDGLRT